jgi:hypothetical protein
MVTPKESNYIGRPFPHFQLKKKKKTQYPFFFLFSWANNTTNKSTHGTKKEKRKEGVGDITIKGVNITKQRQQ